MSIGLSLIHSQRRKIQDMKCKTTSRVEAMRCRIVLLLDSGEAVSCISAMVDCVRSTVYTTLYRFEDEGISGLLDKRRSPGARKATPEVRAKLLSYLDDVPKEFGWQRSTWTLELLTRQLHEDTGVQLSPSHLRAVLRQEKCRRGRPRPALRIPVRGRRKILDNIERLIEQACPDHEVFYLDEADIDLNPRIGLTYIKRGEQPLVHTPGQNVKYYIGGALNARTGTILYAHGPRKNSDLFIDALYVLANAYRRAQTIHVVLDNYIIHKSAKTKRALETLGERIQLHFLPPYSPEHNPIERLWKQLHDNVTRNHRHKTMPELWNDVTCFMTTAQPFPGTKVSTLRAAA
jgi:transposase